MDILATLVADRQPPEVVEPGHRALHHPAVPPQAGLVLDALPGDAAGDPPPPEVRPAAADVVALVGVQLPRTLAPSAIRLRRGRDTGDQRLEDGRVRARRPGQPRDQREPVAVDRKMALRAGRPLGSAAIPRVLAGRRAPFLARTLALSRLARDQSIRSAPPSLSSRARWRACQTPAACQSRRRRQLVAPLPQPSSSGRSSRRIPVWST